MIVELASIQQLAVLVKQASVIDAELEGAKENGQVKNVQTVLKTNQMLSKMKGVDEDRAFLFNAESAMIFYRNKNYDVDVFRKID